MCGWCQRRTNLVGMQRRGRKEYHVSTRAVKVRGIWKLTTAVPRGSSASIELLIAVVQLENNRTQLTTRRRRKIQKKHLFPCASQLSFREAAVIVVPLSSNPNPLSHPQRVNAETTIFSSGSTRCMILSFSSFSSSDKKLVLLLHLAPPNPRHTQHEMVINLRGCVRHLIDRGGRQSRETRMPCGWLSCSI